MHASNDVEPLVAYLAALRAGHVVLLTGDGPERSGTPSSYDPDIVVGRYGSGWETRVRRAASEHTLHPDLALLLGTSGSTGSSKLVRLSHANVDANAEAIAEYLDIDDGDVAATTLPMHYCYGLSVVHSHLLRGAVLLLTDRSVVDRCFWDRFRELGGTTFAAVPYTFDLLDRVGFESMRLPRLRYVTQAGGRLEPGKVRRWAEVGRRNGWDLVVMYGQTEATARMAYLPPDLAAAHPESIGVPIPGGSFEIETEGVDGAPPGVGELVYRGPNVMLGYAEAPEDLALGRTLDVLRTGDLARQTGDGLYEVVGRRSRFLKLFGLRIDLQQVERILGEHGFSALCAGDDEMLAVAVVTSHGSAPVDRVRELVHEHVGLPTTVVEVVPVDALPRLASGKPDYAAVGRACRDRAARRASHQAASGHQTAGGRTTGVPRPDALELIRRTFTDVLGCRRVPDDATFLGLGGDSLSYVEMSIALEDRLGNLPAGWHTMAVEELAAHIRPRRPLTRVETNVALRAAAIVLVVGTHAGLFALKGGAHVLLAVAGFNFARFQLADTTRNGATRPLVLSITRVAVPSMLWIAAMATLTGDYSLANIALVNHLVGTPTWNATWHYWFVEALVQILAVTAALCSMPQARRLLCRFPYGVATVVLLAALAVRFELFGDLGYDVRRIHAPGNVLWIFAFGWAVQRARTGGQRAFLTVVALAAVPGFAGEPRREALVLAGLLALLWVPTIVVPRVVTRGLGLVAGASLYIYLTHWQVYPELLERGRPLLALVASLLVGIAASSIAQRAARLVALTAKALFEAEAAASPRWAATLGRGGAVRSLGR